MRRWTTAKRLAKAGQASGCILDVDRWVIPVHLGNHWTCAMVDLAARALVYYDSYHVRTPRPARRARRALVSEVVEVAGSGSPQACRSCLHSRCVVCTKAC